jgi:glycosyltransferase involved in cell wall biosynthesis
MTACLQSGDAIGHYVEMLRRAFLPHGEVAVFADLGTGDIPFLPSTAYVPTTDDVLWFHYSIYADNFACLRQHGPDFKVMDFHGVCPPDLFEDDEQDKKQLTGRALEELPKFREVFDLCIVHSDYSARVLRDAGYERIVKTPLAIGSALADAVEEPYLAQRLSRLGYLLYVGRVVVQKDVLGLIDLFARVRGRHPDLKLWIVGDLTHSPLYRYQIQERIRRLELEAAVGLTGSLRDPALLKPLFKHARLFVTLSRWESFCVPVVEAMGFGVPAVSTEPTVAEIMGGTGLAIDHADPNGAALKVAALLADTEMYAELRRRCLERARVFTERHMVESVLDAAREHFPQFRDAK